MADYRVPDEIRNLPRPNGTKVKKIKGHYYVYESSSTKRKVELEDGTCVWKSVTKSGKCIGTITLLDGFIPNSNKLAYDKITVVEYGEYAMALKSTSTLSELKSKFNAKDANQIYVVAIITVTKGFTYMRDMSDVFEESFLSLKFPDVKVGKDALRTLYENLGKRRTRVDMFEQALIDGCSKRVSFDGHVIACASEKSDLSAYGYKASMLNSEQMNWMTAFDLETGRPLASELFNGADPDKVVVKQFFDRFTFKDTLFVVDRGFNTEAIKKLMSSNGNSYIMPMIQGRNDYKSVYGRIKFVKRRSFVYDKDGYSSLICYQEFLEENTKRIAYLDTTRQSAERVTYIKNMKSGKTGYTEDGLLESEKDFGLFILETSDASRSAKDVFGDYKSRWGIETFYDYIDNTIDFNSLCQQNYNRTEGLSFIIQVAGMIHQELKDIVNEKHYNLRSVMKTLRGLHLSSEKGAWNVKNKIKAKRELAEQFGVSLNPSISSPA